MVIKGPDGIWRPASPLEASLAELRDQPGENRQRAQHVSASNVARRHAREDADFEAETEALIKSLGLSANEAA